MCDGVHGRLNTRLQWVTTHAFLVVTFLFTLLFYVYARRELIPTETEV